LAESETRQPCALSLLSLLSSPANLRFAVSPAPLFLQPTNLDTRVSGISGISNYLSMSSPRRSDHKIVASFSSSPLESFHVALSLINASASIALLFSSPGISLKGKPETYPVVFFRSTCIFVF
jgi:hypothetical protein